MDTARLLRNSARRGVQMLASIAEIPASWQAPARIGSMAVGGSHLRQHQGLWLWDGSGDAAQLGRDGGRLLAGPTRRLLQMMRYSPGVMLTRIGRRGRELSRAVPQAYREEARCWAVAAGCDPEMLLRCNSVADACCTAVVTAARAGQPLIVGRNLDFFPAGALGRSTMVALMRRTGVRSIASVTWPGFNGVLSGINDAGVSACVLLNLSSRGANHGMPIAYRVREILEQAGSCEQALQLFPQLPVGSSHYLLLADATTAAVVWQGGGRSHLHRMQQGFLSCSNGKRSPDGLAIDDRGRHLDHLSREGALDCGWMRSAITSTYLPGINAQAMVFIPGRCELQLALGDAYRPAALNRWLVLPLAEAFAGTPLTRTPLSIRERHRPLAHFADPAGDARRAS